MNTNTRETKPKNDETGLILVERQNLCVNIKLRRNKLGIMGSGGASIPGGKTENQEGSFVYFSIKPPIDDYIGRCR